MQFVAATVQMLATSDKEANLREADGWVRRAHAKGARLVVLPEVFNWRGVAWTPRPTPSPFQALPPIAWPPWPTN